MKQGNEKKEGQQELPVYRYYIRLALSLFLFFTVYTIIVSPTAFHTSSQHTATFTSLTVLFSLTGVVLAYDSVKGILRHKRK